MAGVSFREVDKRYGDVAVIEDLNLEIRDQEFMVLVGPSGCGKSTALRMVAGLEEISSGTISIGDRVVNELPPKDRDIAMVFQNYALYPHMTIRENLEFGLKMRGTPRDETARMVDEAAEILGLTPISTASRSSSPAGSASGWLSAERSCATRPCSSSTSRSRTSTRSFGARCAPRSRASSTG